MNTLCNAGEGHYEVNTLRTAPTSDGGKSILRAIGRGGPRKSRLLRALKWQPLHSPPFPTIQITYTAAAILMYLKLPVFYMTLGLMILMGANPLIGPLDGVGLRNGFARMNIITSRVI